MKRSIMILIAVMGILTACAETNGDAPGEPETLLVMTHDSFAISEEVLAQFESENNATVEFLKAGDTGADDEEKSRRRVILISQSGSARMCRPGLPSSNPQGCP